MTPAIRKQLEDVVRLAVQREAHARGVPLQPRDAGTAAGTAFLRFYADHGGDHAAMMCTAQAAGLLEMCRVNRRGLT